MEYLGINQIPFCIVFTKADKLKPKAIENHVEDYSQELLKTWEELPQYFVTSSTKALGRDEILQFIEDTNIQINSLRSH
jgi:GTP-binding protein